MKYRKSYLGVFWTVLAPAASAVIYFTIFSFVIKIQIPNYLVFILSGTLAWSFFSTSLLQGLESIVGNHSLISKVPTPLNVFPLTEVMTLFINLLFSMPVLLVTAVITGAPVTFYWLLLPFLFFLLFIQVYGITLMAAIAFVYLRDLRHLFNILMQLFFYMNPIIYSTTMIPEKYQPLLYLMPTPFIFEGIHKIMAHGELIELNRIVAASLWTFGLLVASYLTFNKYKNFLAERI